ncbi:MAG TPA: TIM barrel protein [Ktedonobacterales bacterium]|nr:TIM barrel protein [Ktedonobacterales bacterium]
MTQRIHLGINTCFAVKRWPEPEQWIRIITQDLGLDCCQFSLDLVDPLLDADATRAYAEETRQRAADAGLYLHSSFTGLAAYSWSHLLHPNPALRQAAMQWYERAIAFTAQLGAHGTGGHLGAYSVADSADTERSQQLLAELRGRLQSLARVAAEHSLDFLLFENMAVPREFGYNIEEARWLAEITTDGGVPLVLCLDVGHPCALHTGTTSDDYRAWLAERWPTTPVIHLQQTDRTGDHHWPFTQEYNQRGIVEATPIIAALTKWQRLPETDDIYLFLEPIHPFEADETSVLDELRESVRYWRDALAQ